MTKAVKPSSATGSAKSSASRRASRRAISTTERAGLKLSVRRTEKQVRDMVPGKVRLSTKAIIGVTAAVESVLKTLLERAAECSAAERKTHRINSNDIALAVHTTPALHSLLGSIEMPRRMPIATAVKQKAAAPKRRQTKRRALNAIVST